MAKVDVIKAQVSFTDRRRHKTIERKRVAAYCRVSKGEKDLHKISHPYHSHSRCGTLRKAIRDIKSHDQFQLNGRKPVHKH